MKNRKIEFPLSQYKVECRKYDLKQCHVSINGENEIVTIKQLKPKKTHAK